MSFYHWFPSHPNESELSGDEKKLHDIGQELQITAAKKEKRPPQTDFQRISSVPDVWSQHRLFDMLLLNTALDPSYVEYESIARREWRAMIAIVVLAESYGISLLSKQIDLDEKKANNAFLSAAYSMRPNNKTWNEMELYYIEHDGREYPIAMSSPTVHLVPAKDAWQNLRAIYPGRIPFLTEDMVYSPVVKESGGYVPFMLGKANEARSYAMLPVHALLLKEWLTMYRAQAPDTQNKDLLESYENALSDAYSLKQANMPTVSAFFATETQRTGTRLWGARVPNRLQIFLDRVFYAPIELNSAIDVIPDTHKLAGGIAGQSIFTQHKANGDYAHYFIAMPVTETFWQLWQNNLDCKPAYAIDCEYNAKTLELTKITVSVSLGSIRFSKTYSADEIDSDYWRNLCSAGIWPRQKIAEWTDYFMFCYESNHYRVEPLKKRPEYKAKTYEQRDGIEGSITYYKLTYAPDCCVLLKNRTQIGYFLIRERQEVPAGDDSRVYRASIDFGTSSTTLYGGLEETEPKRISGMNLWSFPLINTLNSEGWETSRMEKYFFPPLPTPIERATLNRKSEALKTASFEEIQNDSDLSAFYPSCVPMQSILADAMNTNEARSFLRDSWIYFRNFAVQRKVEHWPKIWANLKWAHADPEDQHRIRAMLAQILEMIALEARSRRCGKIAVTASYPLSFEDATRETFYDALNEMLRVVCSTTGLLVLPPKTANHAAKQTYAQETLVDSITESEAVFRFAVHQDRMSQNYYTIDIGGGSTDIFISLNNQKLEHSLYSTSLGFGARKVLLDKLRHDENRILRLLMDRADDSIQKIIPNQREYIDDISGPTGNSTIEDLFALRVPFEADHPAAALVPENFGEAFLKYCAGTRGDLLFLELKKRIAFYIGATIWLSGMMLRQDKGPDLKVAILFAGNGSKMLRWLDPELDRTRYFIYQLFQKSVGMQMERNAFGSLFSAMPKEEVAYGSLLELSEGYYDLKQTDATQVFFDRENKQTSSMPTYHSLRYERKDIATDRTEFENFLKTYRECAIISYEWPFAEEEYDVSILENSRLGSAIAKLQKDWGYFLGAVEIISSHYMGEITNKQVLGGKG